MSVTYPLRHATLLYRRPDHDPNAEGFLDGDVYEFQDIAIHEVDPVTRKAKADLQCFLVGRNKTLTPVRRGSWLH